MSKIVSKYRNWPKLVQQITGESVEVAFVDQGYTGETASAAAQTEGIRLKVVKLPEARKGFVLLPRRARSRTEFCLDGEVSPRAHGIMNASAETLVGLHLVAFAILMLSAICRAKSAKFITPSSHRAEFSADLTPS